MKILPFTVALASAFFSLSLPAIARTSVEPTPATTTQLAQVLFQREGVLEDGDEVLQSDNSLYDIYTFSGQARQQITIDLESDEFDTYLAIFNSDGSLLGENDDTPGSTNSSITMTLPADGDYLIVVNGYDSSDLGRYLLTVY